MIQRIALVLLCAKPRPAAAFLPAFRTLQLRNIATGSSTTTNTLYSTTNKWAETAEISSLAVIQLKALLREKGLSTSGRKSELILRLHVDSLQESLREVSPAAAKVQEVASVRAPVRFQKKITQKKTQQRTLSTAVQEVLQDTPRQAAPKTQEKTASTSTKNEFQEIQVPPRLVARLTDMGMTQPTPIQREAIPKAITGRDVMGLAQTGTGKTLAFGVPLVAQMLNNNSSRPKPKSVRGLVLAPTRELANQIAVELNSLTEGTPVGTMVVVGGKNIQTQINKLKTGTDLLVATPGRLLDLMDRKSLTLKDTTFLVLDEADLMLDMGFLPDLRRVVKMLPKKRQTMCFSATMSKSMNEVASSYLKNPVRVQVARAGKTADKVSQELHYVARMDKGDKLIDLLQHHKEDRTLVFGRTKHGMEKLSKRLVNAGFKADSIHGNKSQPQRDRAIAAFKSGATKVLVATDVAARGLDIPDVKHVYNYELPNVPEAYVHRIGRTARAGKEGAAVAFCSMEEMDDLLAIQKVTGNTIPVVSGSPWTRTQARAAKDAIKENKQKNQQARRNPSKRTKPKSARGPTRTRYSKR